jgi:erythromycin esterase
MKGWTRSLITLVIVIFLLAFTGDLFAQGMDDDERSLAGRAIKINSLRIGDTNYKDLDALKEKIGDARIVLLGEESHGAGTTFKMKGRLIRFLHREMGFDVLAWESGASSVHFSERGFNDPDVSAYDAAMRGIFSVWISANEMQSLLRYLKSTKKTKKPIYHVGFDCQFSSGYSLNAFVDDIEAFLNGGDNQLVDEETTDELRSIITVDFVYCQGWGDKHKCAQLIRLANTILSIC